MHGRRGARTRDAPRAARGRRCGGAAAAAAAAGRALRRRPERRLPRNAGVRSWRTAGRSRAARARRAARLPRAAGRARSRAARVRHGAARRRAGAAGNASPALTPAALQGPPTLTKPGYYTHPPLDELAALPDATLAALRGFVVGRAGYGRIEWDGTLRFFVAAHARALRRLIAAAAPACRRGGRARCGPGRGGDHPPRRGAARARAQAAARRRGRSRAAAPEPPRAPRWTSTPAAAAPTRPWARG
jgi:hypothetical protein